ncbi:hypothetical protein [Photobacterium alginatilyticum]|uniref:GtrA-like protein domain-containing protein n=1 Tax=Photobacterium alginatilyticum TaxID=1775171 RepID=A0ABW9YLN1_9GAMM|nr:hypothetical protein [Photobacterium alginatilyticum]NBI54721.1 hypothetical protein [Photobacterium alginatilyticum]
MEQSYNSTLSRIGHSIKVFLKFLWKGTFFLIGILGLGLILYDIFEYSISFSELDYSELIFLGAFVILTRNYFCQVKSSQTGAFKGFQYYFIPQGYLLGAWFTAAIALAIIMKNLYVFHHPILNITYFSSVLVVIRVSNFKIKRTNLALPAPKKEIEVETTKENLQ